MRPDLVHPAVDLALLRPELEGGREPLELGVRDEDVWVWRDRAVAEKGFGACVLALPSADQLDDPLGTEQEANRSWPAYFRAGFPSTFPPIVPSTLSSILSSQFANAPKTSGL